jgi:hypothetical protein
MVNGPLRLFLDGLADWQSIVNQLNEKETLCASIARDRVPLAEYGASMGVAAHQMRVLWRLQSEG